jgi:ribose 5-phosphate isomerase B
MISYAEETREVQILNISISSDHAGYELRKKICVHLNTGGHTLLEHGAVSSDSAYSYVSAAKEVSRDVASGLASVGIVICGTGIGVSIVCNKHKRIRCALCANEFMATMAREHNDANVLALGARVIGYGLAISIVDRFLDSSFESGGRHQERVSEIAIQEDTTFNHS